MTEAVQKNRPDDLLIELGCEELPPKALDTIREAFFQSVQDGLEKNSIEFAEKGSACFSSPRRIALLLSAVAPAQPDQDLERRGPAVRAAFDDEGKPTGAALGFARSVGKEVSELERLKTDKGEWLYCQVQQAGKPLSELLYPVIEQAIRQLPVPKPMRWGNNDFTFVRPVHWLVVMHGATVIDGSLFGLAAGNTTRGHRIHAPGPHELPASREYKAVLESSCVIVDQDKRKERIRDLLLETDENVIIDEALLAEVTNLVEWPSAVACTFETEFLEVPHAALVASMQDHQKFFPVGAASDSDEVSNRFIAISNVDSLDVSAVREGYERVIRPRLADARFFLEQDLQTPLEDNLAGLDRVVFQQKLGSVGDKSRRISAISRKIAEVLSIDPAPAERAALLSKCDLLSQMVGEFPELQGQMGQHYALAGGESDEVARAIGEHYAPRFAGDGIPSGSAGQIVSIADRLDTLVGIFGAGLKPTGNKDPFALRRAALGLVRILLEAQIELPLKDLVSLSFETVGEQIGADRDICKEVTDFVSDRLRNHYSSQGYSTELVNAVLSSSWDTLPDFERRLKSIDRFMGQEEAQSLAAANKRIGNILRKSESGGSAEIEADRLIIPQESALLDEVIRIEGEIDPLLKRGDYETALSLLARLKNPVSEFFDAVMVMDEDPVLRENRLAILARLKAQFDRITDLSVLG